VQTFGGILLIPRLRPSLLDGTGPNTRLFTETSSLHHGWGNIRPTTEQCDADPSRCVRRRARAESLYSPVTIGALEVAHVLNQAHHRCLHLCRHMRCLCDDHTREILRGSNRHDPGQGNCLIALLIIGPRHTTACRSFSSRRLMEITLMPEAVAAGTMVFCAAGGTVQSEHHGDAGSRDICIQHAN